MRPGSADKPSVTEFAVASIIPELSTKGFALLPGLTGWFDILSPLNHWEAWRALGDKNVVDVISSHPKQRRRYFLNDSGKLDEEPQLSIDFEAKTEKSHLTLVEGAEGIATSRFLPHSVRSYFEMCSEFISTVREVFSDVLPTPSLPTVLKMRVFEYHASEISQSVKDGNQRAMRPHVDGSICTLIIAKSDGRLLYEQGNGWRPAVRNDGKTFALVIPGIVATHDYKIDPTPHLVLASAERRVSITIFFTPELSENRDVAEQEIAHWKMKNKEFKV